MCKMWLHANQGYPELGACFMFCIFETIAAGRGVKGCQVGAMVQLV